MTKTRRIIWAGVVVVLLVVAALGTHQYRQAIRRSEEGVLKTNLFRMRDAIDQYRRDKQQWPASLDDLVRSGSIRAIPEDPVTRTRIWRTVPSPQGGVGDVKSTSPGVAVDGSRYAEW